MSEFLRVYDIYYKAYALAYSQDLIDSALTTCKKAVSNFITMPKRTVIEKLVNSR